MPKGKWRRNHLFKKIVLSKYLSVFLGMVFVLISIGVWRNTENDSLNKLSEHMQTDSQLYINKIDDTINSINFNLGELAEYGPPSTFIKENTWDVRTEFYLENLPGIEHIAWIDRDLIVRRVTPTDNNKYILNEYMISNPDTSNNPTLMVPMYEYDVLVGFIISDIDVSTLILSSESEIENDYMFQIYHESRLISTSSNWEDPVIDMYKEIDISFENNTYRLVLTPTQELVSQSKSGAYLILIYGLFGSIVTSGLIVIVQIVRKNETIVNEKSKTLEKQNVKLEIQRNKLDELSNNLEGLVHKKTLELKNTIGVLENEKKLTQKYLNELEQAGNIFENSIKNAPLPIMIHAEDGTVLNISKTWSKLTDYTITDISTIYKWTEKAYGKSKDEVQAFIDNLYTLKTIQNDGEFTVTTKNGRQLIWDFYSSYIGTLPDGRAVVMSAATDVTKRKQREEKIEYLSNHDSLTGLYNRRYYNMQLEQLDIPDNYPLTLVMCDINGLKLVNDAFGHKEGDILLTSAAKVILNACKKTDVVARIGGDEFIMIMPKTTPEDAEKIISKIKKESKKITVNSIELSISFGLKSKTENNVSLLEIYRAAEDYMYQEKLSEIPSMRSGAIATILNTLHEKDQYSEVHSKVVSKLSTKLAKKLAMSRKEVSEIQTAGLLHDIGKTIVPISIITKKSALTKEEYELIKKHPEIGYRILNSSKDMRDISEIILHHHERWDGLGYPNQVKGDAIPIQSRIIAIADAYDAMTSERPYRSPLSQAEALKEISDNAGTQFDPKLAELFVNNFEEINKINM